MRRFTAFGGLIAVGMVAACRGGTGAKSADSAFHGPFAAASLDPTVRPARLLPEIVDETQSYGVEPASGNTEGGVRAIMAGLRVVSSPDGALVAADDRLPQAPSKTVALPERLGGGFLFVLGNSLWRADRWLGPAKPIFTSSQSVQGIIPGLDRVYVRSPNATSAIDGQSGKLLDLGPWPASPYVASYAAADGWRAAAVADLRGVVATFDAGATWRTLDLPIEAKVVTVDREALAIGGFDNAKTEAWYEVAADGSVARLAAAPKNVDAKLTPSAMPTRNLGFQPRPAPPPTEPKPEADPKTEKEDYDIKTFGKRPLAAAIEDGWPLTDGSAVIARDGALARVRIADGALLEVVHDAFPMKPARCHPVTLTRPERPGAFGFVCGEARGATVLYAYDRGRLNELRRFDKPRVVTSSGNGALAVRGACAADADPTPPAQPDIVKLKDAKELKEDDKAPPAPPPPAAVGVHPYCVLGQDDVWREIHVRGDVDGERVIVLADGRIVVVSPPQGVNGPARLTVLEKGGKASTIPVLFPKLTPDVARMVRLGLWLDGFEERRPGVVGGWLEAGGAFIGLEIALDGKATLGQFVQSAGSPFVSGKYGLGWTASHRGYETVDGGMKWTSIELPDPLVPATKIERRACGPIGCLANGWLRVGWGEPKHETPPMPPSASSSTTANFSVAPLSLACEPLASAPPSAPARSVARTVERSESRGRAYNGSPVLSSFNGLAELTPFFNQPGPPLRESDRGLNYDIRETVERDQKFGNVAKVYAWGPKTGADWDALGRWEVKWLSPFYAWPEIRVSLPTAPPPFIVDMTHGSSGGYYYSGYGYGYGLYQLASGDDPSHALLVAHRASRSDPMLYEVEADRAPLEIRRADGEPFGDLEGAVRASGRWFVATSPGAASNMYGAPPPSPYSVIWQIEGGTARELARVPRAASDVPSFMSTYGYRSARLVRRSDGRAVGILADGQPTAQRSQNTRWVMPIDLESGALGEPELLGWTDLAGRPLAACTDDAVGWVVDTPMPGWSSVHMTLPHASGSLQSTQARMRLSTDRACIERLTGTYDGQSPERAAELVRGGAPSRSMAPTKPGDIVVSVTSTLVRYPLRCTIVK